MSAPATEAIAAGGMLLKKWCKVTGVSPRTARRWRTDPSKNFKTFWRYGMIFVHPETLATFAQGDVTQPSSEQPSPPAAVSTTPAGSSSTPLKQSSSQVVAGLPLETYLVMTA